ncbi:serine/threonine-protein kinase ATM isoform X2 [Cucumis melo var. makuwa]|uniref:Serine/threonine-protein kinase ATM isoform X2 n=1 Tax=Cucumis melo var. makuwa TaxID=1194695 RepID=A0A5D3BHQ9_CUCMM|nr:serine/threonine-protein kinase ATM isoform X2 [Cucumis melo var. makuwa]
MHILVGQNWVERNHRVFQDKFLMSLECYEVARLFTYSCSSFGVPLVLCSKQKVVTAKEVLDAGLELGPTMETIIVTVGHLALHSDAMELEAVFMLCAISAIDPSQREMVSAMLDNLSRELNYSGRQKVKFIA